MTRLVQLVDRRAEPLRAAPPSPPGSRRRDRRRHVCARPYAPTSARRRCNPRLPPTGLSGRRAFEIRDLKFEIRGVNLAIRALKFEIQSHPPPPIDGIAANP